jgi:FG-GAP repeat
MKNHSASFTSAETRIISPALTDFLPHEIIATVEQVHSGAAEPNAEGNICAHQLDCRVNLADQSEVGLVAAGEMLRKAPTSEKIFLPRRTVGQRFGPLLYWLATFVVVPGPVLGESQADLQPAPAQFSQEGSKLVGTFAAGLGEQGWSIALSADGNTAVVGGLADNRITGAAWVYTRSKGIWTQQSKLVGTSAVGSAGQGWSVVLSADGSTAIVGGPFDNWNTGAAWVFTRGNGVWTQQGTKLVGSGAVGSARQGASVALSADGNTVIVGAPADNEDRGAAWVFTRSNGVWTQLGNKLVGAGAVGNAGQGSSVALSADGNTAIVGGPLDNSKFGAAWVFTRSGGVWTQPGKKLVGAGAVGNAGQGSSVALSADGSTAIMGGPFDNSNTGAAWVYTCSGTVWGAKLVGTGAIGNARQGVSVALSSDGSTAIVGGVEDNSYIGAAWVYSRGGTVWTQQANKLVGTDAIGSARQGSSVALSADGNTAIVGGLADNRITGAAWIYKRSGGVSTIAETELHTYRSASTPLKSCVSMRGR